jgi:hypothetical protein
MSIVDPVPDPARRMLDGPEGRYLCRLVAWVEGFGPVRDALSRRVGRPVPQPSRMALLDELQGAVATGNYQRFLHSADEVSLLAKVAKVSEGYGLYRPVLDDPAADEREIAILLPVAEAVVAAPGAEWWTEPIARHDQHFVYHHLGDGSTPPNRDTFLSRLQLSMKEEQMEEADARAANSIFPPPDYTARIVWSRPDGAWWTTRSIPGLPAVGLLCFPDQYGPLRARHWPVTVDARARVYEIDSAEAWRQIVSRYSRDVSYSRRDAWWPSTGWAGSWLLPDWTAVAADYDGVHLSVAGYLEIDERPIPVGDARSMVVAWGPDNTYWLIDVIELKGEPDEWEWEVVG